MTVTVYTGPACAYCLILKRFLEANKVKYREIDISKDKDMKVKMQEISKQTSVPVVEINGIVIVGYDIKKLKKTLRID